MKRENIKMTITTEPAASADDFPCLSASHAKGWKQREIEFTNFTETFVTILQITYTQTNLQQTGAIERERGPARQRHSRHSLQ